MGLRGGTIPELQGHGQPQRRLAHREPTGSDIPNNIIDFNRTGIHFVDNVSGSNVQNNFITNNWTMGVLFRGLFPPAGIRLARVSVNNNDISGNWYSQIEAAKSAQYVERREQLVGDPSRRPSRNPRVPGARV
ncbi:hypothetical protein [Candidatus Amarobacter glycogenicus]|uniref:hypothetical protein n=1 Tax=Candidatus Amarobacter glycogenicus TaxID=3140699 RepID=UPI003134AAE6|nr:hypothetical protein [Dehalococcoidia bacterium]